MGYELGLGEGVVYVDDDGSVWDSKYKRIKWADSVDAYLGKTSEKVGKTEGVVTTEQPNQFTQTAERQLDVTQPPIPPMLEDKVEKPKRNIFRRGRR